MHSAVTRPVERRRGRRVRSSITAVLRSMNSGRLSVLNASSLPSIKIQFLSLCRCTHIPHSCCARDFVNLLYLCAVSTLLNGVLNQTSTQFLTPVCTGGFTEGPRRRGAILPHAVYIQNTSDTFYGLTVSQQVGKLSQQTALQCGQSLAKTGL